MYICTPPPSQDRTLGYQLLCDAPCLHGTLITCLTTLQRCGVCAITGNKHDKYGPSECEWRDSRPVPKCRDAAGGRQKRGPDTGGEATDSASSCLVSFPPTGHLTASAMCPLQSNRWLSNPSLDDACGWLVWQVAWSLSLAPTSPGPLVKATPTPS